MRRPEQQTILITGSTDGLGRGVAERLSREGSRILVHGRDPSKIDRVVGELDAADGYEADLSSLELVRQLGERLRASQPRLDVLVNNAGVISPERRESADGYELTFAVNYLAGFALTAAVLPLLEPPARIVNVASIGQAPIDFDDVMLERDYDRSRAYGQSKLAQIMFTFELAPRLEGGVTVNALHPATLMDTKLVRENIGRTQDSVGDGADSVVRLITDSGLDDVSGRFFDRTEEAAAEGQAYDEDARRRLWDLSEELTGAAYPRG